MCVSITYEEEDICLPPVYRMYHAIYPDSASSTYVHRYITIYTDRYRIGALYNTYNTHMIHIIRYTHAHRYIPIYTDIYRYIPIGIASEPGVQASCHPPTAISRRNFSQRIRGGSIGGIVVCIGRYGR